MTYLEFEIFQSATEKMRKNSAVMDSIEVWLGESLFLRLIRQNYLTIVYKCHIIWRKNLHLVLFFDFSLQVSSLYSTMLKFRKHMSLTVSSMGMEVWWFGSVTEEPCSLLDHCLEEKMSGWAIPTVDYVGGGRVMQQQQF